jgi:hypothetical protein
MRRTPLLVLALFAPLLAARCGRGSGPSFDESDLVHIRTDALPSGSTGLPYAALVAADGPNPPFVWRLVGGRLPEGLVLDASSGAIDGWPRVPGRFAFDVEVRDGEDRVVARDTTFASARRRFAIEVTRGPLAVLPFPVPRAQYRAPYAHRLEAAGGVPPYRFARVGGALPAGLDLATDGTISGSADGAPGPHDCVVRVYDTAGAAADHAITVEIVVLPLGVSRGDLSDAAMGVPYDRGAGLSPRGAGPPYAWRALPSDASLPPGLVLDGSSGRVVGTPTTAGTFAFRLEATDAASQTASAAVTIRVNPGPVLERLEPPARPRDGRPVVLSGQAFQPGMTLAFGNGEPLAVAWESATRASIVVPAAPAQRGVVDVRVENPDGGAYDLVGGFRFPWERVEYRDDGLHGTSLSSSRALAAGDTDGDGLDDVVHVGSTGIEVLRPIGPDYAGAWQTVAVRASGSYNDVRLADVDRDGDLDIVTIRSATTETIETYRNDGSGGFPATASWSGRYDKPSTHFPFALDTGDVDGDGVPDVAFTSGSGNQSYVWVYRGLGDGSFVLVEEAAGSVFDAHAGCFAPNAVALADLDGDGRDDVVVTDAFPTACAAGEACPTTDGEPDLRPGRGDVVAWVALSGPGGAPGAWRSVRLSGANGLLDGDNLGLAVTDLDRDGDLDLAVCGGLRDERGTGIAFLRNDGHGTFHEHAVRSTTYNRRFAAPLDADQDGVGDVLVVGGDGRRGMDGAQGYSVAEVFMGGSDAPWLAWSTGPEPFAGIPDANPGRVACGDFDGDGRPDFAVDQSFHAKERFENDQGDGLVEGVRIYVNRSQ